MNCGASDYFDFLVDTFDIIPIPKQIIPTIMLIIPPNQKINKDTNPNPNMKIPKIIKYHLLANSNACHAVNFSPIFFALIKF